MASPTRIEPFCITRARSVSYILPKPPSPHLIKQTKSQDRFAIAKLYRLVDRLYGYWCHSVRLFIQVDAKDQDNLILVTNFMTDTTRALYALLRNFPVKDANIELMKNKIALLLPELPE